MDKVNWTAKKAIANEISNMLYNNVIKEQGTERFEGWCEDGALFEDYEGLNQQETEELMKKVAPFMDHITSLLDEREELISRNRISQTVEC